MSDTKAIMEPTNEELSVALDVSKRIGQTADIRRLRDKRTTWFGDDEMALRSEIDYYIAHWWKWCSRMKADMTDTKAKIMALAQECEGYAVEKASFQYSYESSLSNLIEARAALEAAIDDLLMRAEKAEVTLSHAVAQPSTEPVASVDTTMPGSIGM